MEPFGGYVRSRREALRATDRLMSVRRVAGRIGVEPSFLSKVERGETPPPSEAKIRALAGVLGEDPDVLLALAGTVSGDLGGRSREWARGCQNTTLRDNRHGSYQGA